MSDAIVTLIGVVAGFLLSEGKQYFSKRRYESELKAALREEISSIRRLIPSKIDLLNQAKKAYSQFGVLRTTSTRSPRTIYDTVLLSGASWLSATQRDFLHVLYERIRVIDESMDGLEADFHAVTGTHDVGTAINMTTSNIDSLLEALNTCRVLIDEYMGGHVPDVYKLGN